MSVSFSEMRNPGLDWSGVSNAVDPKAPVEKTERTGFDAGMHGAGLAFSVGEGAAVGTAESSMPVLDGPDGIGEGLIAGFCEKVGDAPVFGFTDGQVAEFCEETAALLNAAYGSRGAGGASTIENSKSSQAVMFDIYALMALLVECGQAMRDAARDVRQTENLQVQKSIQNQADMQRVAAMTGLVCSIAACAIQVGAQAGNLAYQGKGFGKQMGARRMSGLDDAKAELKMAEMLSRPQDAQMNFEKALRNVDPAVKAKVEGSFNDSRATKAGMENLEGAAGEEARLLYRTQVKSELADIRSDPRSTPQEIAYAEAYAANEISQNSTPQQLADELSVAQMNYNQANAVMQQDAGYMKGVHIENRARMFGDLIAAIGNVAQGCVSSLSQMIGAEATEEGAQQQKAQEMLDQAKDLFAQCQSLIDSAIQLMRAVLQAEVQSMRDAIQA